jgi:hypothetical protein
MIEKTISPCDGSCGFGARHAHDEPCYMIVEELPSGEWRIRTPGA